MLYYMQVPYDALHIQLERWLSWSKAHDWKSCIRGTVSRVRIPFSPPEVRRNFDGITADFYNDTMPADGKPEFIKEVVK